MLPQRALRGKLGQLGGDAPSVAKKGLFLASRTVQNLEKQPLFVKWQHRKGGSPKR